MLDKYFYKEKDEKVFLEFKPNGVFYRLIGNDALIINYLFNTKVKDNITFVAKENILEVMKKIKNLNIDYSIDNVTHHYRNNNYLKYLKYAHKKEDIDRIYEILISEIENE